MQRVRSLFFFVGALWVLPACAAAQDLVTNGHFHTDINGWTLQGQGSQGWDPLDWQGNPSSGSLRVTATAVGPPAATNSRQCIPLSPSGTYELGGHIRFPSGQPGGGLAAVGMLFYGTPDCSGSTLATTQTPVVSSTTVNTWVESFASGITPPFGTASVIVEGAVGMTGGTSLAALFDRVRFGHTGTTPVTAQDFTIE
jgi:hypothetical protein